jgi:RNA polymerase sigma-70 factor (ECF subfamily)
MKPSKTASDELIGLFVKHRIQLNAYACAIVGDHHLAEDVLQEVAMTVVRKQDSYDRSRPFLPWALGITRIRALKILQSRGRHVYIPDEETIDALEAGFSDIAAPDYVDVRKDALVQCMEKLNERGKQILDMKYVKAMKVEVIARIQRKSVPAVNSLLQRIRAKLIECVDRRMSREATA